MIVAHVILHLFAILQNWGSFCHLYKFSLESLCEKLDTLIYGKQCQSLYDV